MPNLPKIGIPEGEEREKKKKKRIQNAFEEIIAENSQT